MRVLLGVGLLVVVSGCAHHNNAWKKPGGTVQVRREDVYECTRDNSVKIVGSLDRVHTEVDEEMFNQCMAARGWTLTE